MMQLTGLSLFAPMTARTTVRRVQNQSVLFSAEKQSPVKKSMTMATVIAGLMALAAPLVASASNPATAAPTQSSKIAQDDWRREIEIATKMDALSLQAADAITDLANSLNALAKQTAPNTPMAKGLADAARELSRYRKQSESLGVTPELVGNPDRQLTLSQWVAFAKYIDSAYNVEVLSPDKTEYLSGYYQYIDKLVNASGNEALIQHFKQGQVRINQLEEAYCALKPSACLNRKN